MLVHNGGAMYKTIKFFTDLHDNNYPYNVGDVFPRDGVTVTAGRLEELSGSDNRRGVPLIAMVEEPESEEEPEKPAAKRGRKPAKEKE